MSRRRDRNATRASADRRFLPRSALLSRRTAGKNHGFSPEGFRYGFLFAFRAGFSDNDLHNPFFGL